MSDTIRSWPLYAVLDLRDRDGVHLGPVTEGDKSSIAYPHPKSSHRSLCPTRSVT
ncbi:hypothetical protein [Nesterenkonia pannonica]|uniref:hypothetical protein n=1 Tax=Nesterenkonia pannonica TaxID=1548602 RepID=UPI002164951A|nr:hypothetical protein [Nesterenkonia pannonica]